MVSSVPRLTRAGCLALVPTLAAVMFVACRRAPADTEGTPGFQVRRYVSPGLLRAANNGREVFRADGCFDFPKGVNTVWVDVGAHNLEMTRRQLLARTDLGVVAIEPLAECWRTWPKEPRLVGVPAAIFLTRGTMDFHVNASNATSSLAASVPGAVNEAKRRTVEIRKVPVLRLEDVLDAVPPDLTIALLASDVQGADLQVLQSAGDKLRRVHRVRVEIINAHYYEDVAGHKGGSEEEVMAYMKKMGFSFLFDRDVEKDRAWLDKVFILNPYAAPATPQAK